MCKAFEETWCEGWERGARQKEMGNIRALMDTTGWSMQQAMDALKVPVDQRTMYAEMLAQ